MAEAKTKSVETKESVREKILTDLEKKGVGRKPMTFILTNGRNNHSLKPKTRYIYRSKDNTFVYNLRYVKIFDSPFEEDQDMDMTVELSRVDFPDFRWVVNPEEKALQMYLLLHPLYGKDKAFYLEDKEADAVELEREFDDMATVIDLCKSSDYESLQAVYSLLNPYINMEENVSVLRAGILNKVNNGVTAKEVIDLFGDRKSKIKFKLATAIRYGVVVVNRNNTELSWKEGGVILSCAPGLDVRKEFATWAAGTEEGGKAYDKILTKVDR